MPTFAAVILTGGTATRLGGADKAGLEVDGRTLLAHALEASRDATSLVVVGPVVEGVDATFVHEDPPRSGPAYALLAGVAVLPPTTWVLALAVDMPRVTTDTVERLLDAANGDGALLVARGRDQYLCALYRRDCLRPVAPGASMRSLVSGLSLARVHALDDEARDVDTWADLDQLRE